MRKTFLLAAAMVLALATAGCVVHEREVITRPENCHDGRWVEGHYGEHGEWHAEHWEC